jgi:hypothetical protein
MAKKTADGSATIEAPKKVYGTFLKDQMVRIKAVESSGKWATLLVKGQEMKKDPFIYNKVKRSFQVPLNSEAKGGGVKTILDNQKRVLIKKYESSYPDGMTEQEFFENELGVETMNPYLKKEDNFWRTDKKARVVLTKEGMLLNLNLPLDMLRYKILLSNKTRISPSYEERKNSQSYEFMLVDENKVTSKRVEDASNKAEAFVKYAEITRNKSSMIGFIKSLGRVIPINHTEDWLKGEILNVLENDHNAFLRIVNDPNYQNRIFIQESIEAGAIKKMNDRRYVLDNGVELGDLVQTINWIEDPEHQETKLRIKSLIEMKNK